MLTTDIQLKGAGLSSPVKKPDWTHWSGLHVSTATIKVRTPSPNLQGLSGTGLRTPPCRQGRSPLAWLPCCCCPAQWSSAHAAGRDFLGTTRASPVNQTLGWELPEDRSRKQTNQKKVHEKWKQTNITEWFSLTWTSGQLPFPSSRASRMVLITTSFTGSSPLMM